MVEVLFDAQGGTIHEFISDMGVTYDAENDAVASDLLDGMDPALQRGRSLGKADDVFHACTPQRAAPHGGGAAIFILLTW